MASQVMRSLDFLSVARILNLPDAVGDQEPATLAQLKAGLEGLNWKDNVRVATPSNVNLAAPGATLDGAAMSVNDRVVVPNQTDQTQNGLYIWNGPATPMTRSLDGSTLAELKNAVVVIDEGTSAGSGLRQTTITGVLGSANIVWATFGASAPPASTGTAGILALATQGEADAGSVANKAMTPQTSAAAPYAARKLGQNIGDGSATTYAVTHNFNTRDVRVEVYRNSGNFDTVLAEIQRVSVNAVSVVFDTPPALNAFRVLVLA